jgi:hypothetical protein
MVARTQAGARDFSAPIGTRVRVVSVLVAAVFTAASSYNFVLARYLPPKSFWPVVLAPALGLLVVVPVAVHARVRGYRVASGELQVIRVGRVNRFALADLERVEHDPRAMEGVRKTIGNDGLGAVTGNFRSKKLGAFEAFVTDTARTVVLRWPDHVLVVSPERPGDFVEEVSAHAGLRR